MTTKTKTKPTPNRSKKAIVNISQMDKLFTSDDPKFVTPAPVAVKTAKEILEAERIRLLNSPKHFPIRTMDISNFPMAEIIRILDMQQDAEGRWIARNIDSAYSAWEDHTSWVYFITIDGRIVKIGETGEILFCDYTGTTSKFRLNKYLSYNDGNCETFVRTALTKTMQKGTSTVSIYAVPLSIMKKHIIVGNFSEQESKVNKAVELQAIDTFVDLVGYLPLLNKNRK